MDAQTVSYSPAPGLSHTTSLNDVMNEAATGHDGFEDRDNYVSSTQCRVLQNSYQLMLERLGASRPGSGS